MDSRTSQLIGASFKGVPFRVRSEVLTEGGRKITLHEYVNSPERFVEDLGEIPPKFTVTAFVHGENFRTLADRLETALKSEGSGRLFLPTFGAVTVFALPYRKDASQTSVGEISFELEFATGRPAAGPVRSLADLQQVFTLGDRARQVLQDVFGDIWNVPTNADNAAVAEFDILASVNGIFEGIKDIMPDENLGTLTQKVKKFDTFVSQLKNDPLQLAKDFLGGTPIDTGLWQEISLGLTDGRGFSNVLAFTQFGSAGALELSSVNGATVSEGSTIPLWPEDTAQRIQRNNNRNTMVNAQRIAALISAYETAAAVDYDTEQDIDETRGVLEAQHEVLMRDDTIDPDLIQSNDEVREAVENIRLAALDVILQKEQEAFVLDTANIRRASSSFVQSFAFYAEEFTDDEALADRAISLRRLNPELAAVSLKNEITIFRAAEG